LEKELYKYFKVMNTTYGGVSPLALACRVGSARTVAAVIERRAFEVMVADEAAMNENEDHAVAITEYLLKKV
jgi:hypothetical protein